MTDKNKVEIVDYLVSKGFRADMATIYADALISYRKASENIENNGEIVKHPRTGNPMENPYLKVRAGAITILDRYGNEHCEALWA